MVDLFVLGQTWIFSSNSLSRKTRLPLSTERLSCFYIQCFTEMDTMCKEGLRKKSLHTKRSFIPWENKGFGNLLWINFVRKKLDTPQKRYTSFHKIPNIFSNLEPGTWTKLKHTYYIWQLWTLIIYISTSWENLVQCELLLGDHL